jgi:hypothetical protein
VNRFVDAAKTVYHRVRRERQLGPPARLAALAAREQEVLAALRQQGYFVVPGFFTADEARELVDEVERVMREYAPLLWNDELQSDTRAFAAERVSPLVRGFHEHPFLAQVARLYMGPDQECFFTLANRVRPVPGNLGSGGGWHRDTAHERQFKAIAYLSDVGPRSGAFEYLPGSHHVRFFVKTITGCGIRHGQSRFEEDEVAEVVARTGVAPVRMTAPAGTLILVDSSGIHRGSPIEEGVRYALTNYCFDRGTIADLRARGKFTNYFVDRPLPAAGGAS